MNDAAKSRKERLAKQLRANLMKRKAQARVRREENAQIDNTQINNAKLQDNSEI